METKEAIRKRMLALRKQMPAEERHHNSLRIQKKIFADPRFQKADVVYLYMACKGEVDMKWLMNQCFLAGKTVAVPKVDTTASMGDTQADAVMDFYKITGLNDLQPGYYGILEPVSTEKVDCGQGFMVVPGVAFSKEKMRIGYGKGFYDRYLARYPEIYTCGAAFSMQVVDGIPADSCDIPLNDIVTEGVLHMLSLQEIGQKAKKAEVILRNLSTAEKNRALLAAAEGLVSHGEEIIRANEEDIKNARNNNMKEGLIDRLLLTAERIESMAEGLRQLVGLEDPIGEVLQMKARPNGLMIGQKRVPLGVIGMIYESRPNVTADAFGLCFKTGNAVILKGGSDAIHSNMAIVKVIKEALGSCGVTEDALQLITDTRREVTTEFMKLNGYVDVLIPRGGAGLIRAVVENSTIPVIETGTGNCHVYVDETADLDMAVDIVVNAKTQRIGVCNACESLLVHEKIMQVFMEKLADALKEKKYVEIRGDEKICEVLPDAVKATEEDWGCEYLDYIMSAKTVKNIEEAINHINTYNTGHSEAIVTQDYNHAQQFLNEIDAAAVYVNASTRFTDGFEFGFGAEIGISTQKLHVRGPMGLLALTTTKYIIYGNGQIRK